MNEGSCHHDSALDDMQRSPLLGLWLRVFFLGVLIIGPLAMLMM